MLEKCNCKTDNDDYLIVDVLSDMEINNVMTHDQIPYNTFRTSGADSTSSSSSSTSESDVIDMIDRDIETDKTISLEKCSIVYFAGYLAKRCIDFFQCKNCETSLTTAKNVI